MKDRLIQYISTSLDTRGALGLQFFKWSCLSSSTMESYGQTLFTHTRMMFLKYFRVLLVHCPIWGCEAPDSKGDEGPMSLTDLSPGFRGCIKTRTLKKDHIRLGWLCGNFERNSKPRTCILAMFFAEEAGDGRPSRLYSLTYHK